MNTLPKLDADAAGRAAVELATRADAAMEFRRRLYGTGFVPLPVQTQGKACYLDRWTQEYERETPRAVSEPFDPNKASTGILCNGLRAIDVDIDDPKLADSTVEIIMRRLGGAPIRDRDGSPRKLLVYLAAEGSPAKKSVGDPDRMVEVLGHGNQFVADGLHTSGKPYSWGLRPGADIALASLTTVTEDQIDGVLTEIGNLIGKPYTSKTNQELHPMLIEGAEKARNVSAKGKFDTLPTAAQNELVAACFSALRNAESDKRDTWLKMGWAAKDAQERGADSAVDTYKAWARQGDGYDTKSDTAMNDNIARFQPGKTSVATLLKAARDAGAGPEIDAIFKRSVFEPIDDAGDTIAPSQDAGRQRRFKYIREIQPDTSPHLWYRAIRQKSTCVLYGPSFVGKTVFAAGLSCAIAQGTDFLGRPCHKAGVFIVELEGSQLVADNIRAEFERQGTPVPENIVVSDEYVHIIDKEEMTALHEDISRFARMEGGCGLVIIDTLSQALAGDDENTQAVMSAAVKQLALLGRKIGATVMVLHHTNKAGELRGSNALPGNTDARIKLGSVGALIEVTYEKFKGGGTLRPDYFRIDEVPMRTDYMGYPEGAAVVTHMPMGPMQPKAGRFKIGSAKAALWDAIVAHEGAGPLSEDAARTQFDREYTGKPGGAKDSRRTAFQRALKDLQTERVIRVHQGAITILNASTMFEPVICT